MSETTRRRLDLLSLVFGVIAILAAALLLSGRGLRLDPGWLLPTTLLVVATWLVLTALPGLRRSREDGP